MLLFKPYHVWPIINKVKRHTRREWDKRRVLSGSMQQCKTQMITQKDDYFAMVYIEEVYKQPLGDMTEVDAQAEGGYTLAQYQGIWEAINRKPFNPAQEVFVVLMQLDKIKVSEEGMAAYKDMYESHMEVVRRVA